MERKKRHGFMVLGLTAALFAGCSKDAPPPPPPPAPAPLLAPPPAPLTEITISERIVFETNTAILLPHSMTILNEVVKILKDHPHVIQVEIAGHTDDIGSDEKNVLLSQQRSDSVKAYLVSQGVQPARLFTRGHGNRVPVALNDTEIGRQQNRRVEFRIMKQAH